MGMLLRLVILAALAWFIYHTARRLLAGPAASRQDKPSADAGEAPVMQRCAHCGVHLPPGESTHSQGRVFCSESHRDAWQRDQPPRH